MTRQPEWSRHTLTYPSGLCEPKELLTFIHGLEYTASFTRLGLTDDEQRAVEAGIMMHPILPPVIEGTGGIREFQFSTPKDSPGSLHLSAYYAYFPEAEVVVLMDLFETDDIGPMTSDERAALKQLFEEVQQELGG